MNPTRTDEVLQVAARTDPGDADGVGAFLGGKLPRLLGKYAKDQLSGLGAHPPGKGGVRLGPSEDAIDLGLAVECPLSAAAVLCLVRPEPGGQVVQGERFEQVYMVRKHYAGPGVTVTESKLLEEPGVGPREVDIVIEAEADGDSVVISLEVNQRRRRASVEWVEQQICKHRMLRTNKLVLISASGFSRMALRKVALEAGKVEAIQPEVVTVDGEPVVKRLFADSITYNPTRCTVELHGGNGERLELAGAPATDIYDRDGALLGPLAFLVHEAAGLESVGRWMGVEAHNHPERENLRTFDLRLDIGGLGYHIKREDTGDLYQILALEISGDFAYRQDEVALTLSRLRDRVYAGGHASLAGRPSVWVGTTLPGATETTLSWRATDVVTPPQQHQLVKPPKRWFPDLLKITAPEHPNQMVLPPRPGE